MCGRYYFDKDAAEAVMRMEYGPDHADGTKAEHSDAAAQSGYLPDHTSGTAAPGPFGEIVPSQMATVLTGRQPHLHAELMNWGFPRNQGSGLVINARAETVLERGMFRESVLHRRCVIPASHYYEWDSEGNRVTFSQKEPGILYMAGFYDRFQNGDRFVILTTAANDSVRRIHDRMPLILDEEELETWIYDGSFLENVLHKQSPQLKKYQPYEQQNLFDFLEKV